MVFNSSPILFLLAQPENKEIAITKTNNFAMFFFIIKTPPRCFFRIILNVLKHGQKLERKNVFAQKLIALPKEN